MSNKPLGMVSGHPTRPVVLVDVQPVLVDIQLAQTVSVKWSVDVQPSKWTSIWWLAQPGETTASLISLLGMGLWVSEAVL